MKNNNPPALGQKENAKHGEVFFPVQKYIRFRVKFVAVPY